MRYAIRPSFVMEPVEDRTLMSVAILSQFPSICMPMSRSAAPSNSSQGPSSGPSSGGVSAGPSQSRAPSAPTGLTATPGGNSIELSWNPVGRNVDTIVVDYSSDGVNFATLAMLDGDQTSFSAEDLDSGQSYSFKLWAMNSKGTSPASEIVSTVLG